MERMRSLGLPVSRAGLFMSFILVEVHFRDGTASHALVRPHCSIFPHHAVLAVLLREAETPSPCEELGSAAGESRVRM